MPSVNRRWLTYLLAFAFALSLIRPADAAAWFCEGQPCALTLWYCCCEGPRGTQDSRCEAPPTKGDTTGAALCAADCGCVMVVTVSPQVQWTKAPTLTPVIHWVLLPTPPVLHVPLPEAVVLTQTAPRGPPERSRPLGTPGLRAPPTA